jgi:hypothetical protein
MRTYTPQRLQSVFENKDTTYRTLKAKDGSGLFYLADLEGVTYAITEDEFTRQTEGDS